VQKLISSQIREGQAIVKKSGSWSKFVTVTQGSARFFGSYGESPNRVFLVAFEDSDGQVFLVKNLRSILWSRRLERPNDGVVSNNGRVAINDWLRIKQRLGGRFYIIDQNGKILVKKDFSSNLGTCAISQDGNYAVVSTLFPENTIYFFDIENGKLKWSYKNHSREPVLGLSISNGRVEVLTGKSGATKKYDYSLTLEGRPSRQDFVKLLQVRTISRGKIEDSIRMLIGVLRSPNKDQVRKGLKELRVLTHRFKKYERLLTPYVSPHLIDKDEEISQLSEDIILKFGERDPEAIEPAVWTILKRIEEHPKKYRENDLRILGMLGRIKPQWVENQIPIIIADLKNSSSWNARRFAAFALGEIGSLNSELVKESIPTLAKYLGSSDWWLPKIKEAEKEEISVQGIKISISLGGPDPEVWVRDAAISALGNIGGKSPEMVKDTIPMIISCLGRPEPYTRKRAVVALSQIAKKGRIYVESTIPILKTMVREDHDKKVVLEAKRLLESISPQAAERFISNIPHLIASLSNENKLVRYKTIRELELMFYNRPSLPKQYYHKALLLMNEAASNLTQCIERIEEELKVSQNNTIRLLLLESLLMAKRTFLEFTVGDFVNSESLKCKFCGKVYKANGIRNHLARTHPERWKDIQPYTDDIKKHLQNKNKTGLSAEEWENRLLEKYEKISRTPDAR
jgi:HEAT repeat protein